jgi:CubicO group peptidase (beta-lactamase class C family)
MECEREIAKAAHDAISRKVFPGCVVGIVTKHGEQTVLPFGNLTYDTDAPVVKNDTIYDVASLTKSIPTASIALQLIDEKKMTVDDLLIQHISEFRNADREQILIKHLLTYTLGGYGLASAVDGVDGKSLHKRTCGDVFETLLTHEFNERPGKKFAYSNIPAALLGMVIERITNKTIDVLAGERFFEPLEMQHTTFFPENFSKKDIAPTEQDDWRGLVHGVVHDETAYVCKKEGKIVGYAGLFSTGPDMLKFLEMLLSGGMKKGIRFFSKEIMKQMYANQISELGETTGLGWELYQPRYMGQYATPNTFGKTGFTGTLFVCDMNKGVGYVILSNRIFPKRPMDSMAINTFRKRIGEILLK